MEPSYIIFFAAASALSYTYLAYPALLFAMTRDRPMRDHVLALPALSVIIPFHNEERWVNRKLDNALSWNYPPDRLQIIAVSDGSTDETEAILRRYEGRVTVVAYPDRQGKPTALNRGSMHATGDILVFSDANVLVQPDAARIMARHYADPEIGAVSGNVHLQPEASDEPLGEGLYMQYERWLYEQESRANTMVGADGALFSIRRECYTPLSADAIADDFEIAMGVLEREWRIHYEPEARAQEIVTPDVKAEFRRKVRMIAGGYQALWRHRSLLNPFRRPAVAVQLLSHKVLRWLVPVFLTAALAASLSAPPSSWLMAAAVAQAGFYGLAAWGWLSVRSRRWLPVYVPYYFCAVNLAAAVGFWRYLRGRQPITWQKAR